MASSSSHPLPTASSSSSGKRKKSGASESQGRAKEAKKEEASTLVPLAEAEASGAPEAQLVKREDEAIVPDFPGKGQEVVEQQERVSHLMGVLNTGFVSGATCPCGELCEATEEPWEPPLGASFSRPSFPGQPPIRNLLPVIQAILIDAAVRCDLPNVASGLQHFLAATETTQYHGTKRIGQRGHNKQLAAPLLSFLDILRRPIQAASSAAEGKSFWLALILGLQKHVKPTLAPRQRGIRVALTALRVEHLVDAGEATSAKDLLDRTADACDHVPSLLWQWITLSGLPGSSKAQLALYAMRLHMRRKEPPSPTQCVALLQCCWEDGPQFSALQCLEELCEAFPAQVTLQQFCVEALMEVLRAAKAASGDLKRAVLLWVREKLAERAPKLFRAGVGDDVCGRLVPEMPLAQEARLRCLAEHLEGRFSSKTAWILLTRIVCSREAGGSAEAAKTWVKQVWEPRSRLWRRLIFANATKGGAAIAQRGMVLLYAHFPEAEDLETLFALLKDCEGREQARSEVPLEAQRACLAELLPEPWHPNLALLFGAARAPQPPRADGVTEP